jgi:hypothetical protein
MKDDFRLRQTTRAAPWFSPNRLLNDLRREPITRVADFHIILGYRASEARHVPTASREWSVPAVVADL